MHYVQKTSSNGQTTHLTFKTRIEAVAAALRARLRERADSVSIFSRTSDSILSASATSRYDRISRR